MSEENEQSNESRESGGGGSVEIQRSRTGEIKSITFNIDRARTIESGRRSNLRENTGRSVRESYGNGVKGTGAPPNWRRFDASDPFFMDLGNESAQMYKDLEALANSQGEGFCGSGANESYIPDFFPLACSLHDQGYGTVDMRKESVDSMFLIMMLFEAQFSVRMLAAWPYYMAVSLFGREPYNQGQEEAKKEKSKQWKK